MQQPEQLTTRQLASITVGKAANYFDVLKCTNPALYYVYIDKGDGSLDVGFEIVFKDFEEAFQHFLLLHSRIHVHNELTMHALVTPRVVDSYTSTDSCIKTLRALAKKDTVINFSNKLYTLLSDIRTNSSALVAYMDALDEIKQKAIKDGYLEG